MGHQRQVTLVITTKGIYKTINIKLQIMEGKAIV